MQMKIEDERAGRLDFVYESELSVDDILKRIGNPVKCRLSSYEHMTENGVLYILFDDSSDADGGLHYSKPQKYAVRFESDGDKTVIRVRYVWEINSGSVPYLLKQDIDDFFCELFDASVTEREKRVWTDGTDEFVKSDPLKLHGSKAFWIVCALFVIFWLFMMVYMNIKI